MAVVRWGRADFEEVPSAPKVRWGRADFEGTAVVVPKVRWGRADFEGVAAVLIAPIPNQSNVEPETLITVTTSVTSGHTADSWTWRRISGPTVTLTGTGGTRTFYAPSGMTGTTLVLGVTATAGGVTSPEQTVTVTTLPQVSWHYSAGTWVGNRPVVTI